MKNTKFWWSFIAFLLIWSICMIYPPKNQDLIQFFANEATKPDKTFAEIVTQAKKLQVENPGTANEFKNLRAAIGTNNIQTNFPNIHVRTAADPTYAILNNLQRKAAGRIKLGLDLQGGTQFRVSLDTSHIEKKQGTNAPKSSLETDTERTRLIEQAVEVLRKRVDSFGVAEPIIQAAGNDIIIQLPGLSEASMAEAEANILKAAFLEFRLVHKDSASLLSQGIIPPDCVVLRSEEKRPDGTYQSYLVERKLANGLTGKFIKRASPSRDQMLNTPEILFSFNSEGAERFGKVTKENIGRQLAIVLDGRLYSAPVIKNAIMGGQGVISGSFDMKEAINLANVLENPLETPVKIIQKVEVSPTLGADTIRSGINSAVLGTLFVAFFMAFYYRRCGVIANIAMISNLIILLGVLCYIGTTLTLPGIAGIVLTVGMAVDANVLIYERLREELALGKSMRGAIAAAYERAFGTIFDSHTTTLISSIILIKMGTGPIKGFGVALTVGVALSLFTALVVTRLIFTWLLSRGQLNKITMFDLVHFFKKGDWDFMKFAKPAFITSWTIILIGIGYGFYRGDKVMGIEFAGGDAITMGFTKKIDVQQLRPKLASLGEPEIQYQRGAEQETLELVTPLGKGADGIKLLTSAFPEAGFKVMGQNTVGATVGQEIRKSAILAIMLSLFGILIYVAFRYEFSFSIGAVLAIIHDVLMTLGIYFLSQRQLSAPMVAAILTIIGFSINDTIVIFDRIREDLKLGVRGTFKEVMNRALNQTFSRTIITSGTVFLATFALYWWGGGAINDFSFTFLVGIITGTYSSIYIASALVLWWHKGERPKMASATQITPENTPNARARA